jgi:hypothetical protein
LNPGPSFPHTLVKLDRTTGALLSFSGYPSGSDITVDGNGLLRVGFQLFTGATFIGDYSAFDENLVQVTGGSGDYTSSRSSIFSDTSSTVRLGYTFDVSTLSARGAHVWDTQLPTCHSRKWRHLRRNEGWDRLQVQELNPSHLCQALWPCRPLCARFRLAGDNCRLTGRLIPSACFDSCSASIAK